MAYIGNTPADKFQTLQKQSFTTSATDTYTLDYAVTNPQDLALFINNVRQNPNDAYTVSGTTLTLSSAITGSDTMYAVFLGRAVETVAPAIGSVTNSMLANSSITLNGSAVSLGGSATIEGITMADQWRVTSNFSIDTGQAVISSNLEQVDTAPQGTLGSAMTVSSGVFTFPSTGFYLVRFILKTDAPSGDGNVRAVIQTTTDNSSYTEIAKGEDSAHNTYHRMGGTVCETLLDITDTSNQKVKFLAGGGHSSGALVAQGTSTDNRTMMTFIRLGDT